ncbi:UNVERIFIED_CONTAM: pntAB [Trichonephila clavipes]
MQIGIPTETVVGESRVAATPETVKKLINAGHSVVIERGAGVKAAYIDSAYEQVGATITDDAYTARLRRVLMVETITIFVLAIFVGYYVVWGVTPALHTPLMAVTNALSSIIIVGAMIQTVGMPVIGVEANVAFQSVNVVSILGAIAVFLASINIFGGFAVTARMLEMFKPKQKKKEG